MRVLFVLASLLLVSVLPLPATGAPPPGNDPTCGTGQPVTATSGAGDPQIPSLVYASLRTGFRAVIAWETAEPQVGRIRYSLDNGATQIVSESSPRLFHLIVIDGLPIGRSLCFHVISPTGASLSADHAFKTRNAMNAYDAASSTYSMNLLVLVNEQSNLRVVEEGLDEYSQLLFDSTDGNVRSGRIITVFGDLLNHNAGYPTCIFWGSSVPGCAQYYDILFTAGTVPAAEGATYRDGIRNTWSAIWMNVRSQGGLLAAGDVGSVLLHEVGHYAFGALDLYGPAGQGPNCWDPVTGISVMGNNFGATEFDDAINRCAQENVATGERYVPSYTLLRQRFPLVPDRMGVIDPGPVGDGGIYARHTFRVLPAVSGPHEIPPVPELQNDAGSGGDAGNHLTSATPVEPGEVYDGTLLSPVDGADVYRFDAPAGSAVEVVAYPRAGCFQLLDASGSSIGGPCVVDGAGVKRTATAPGGTLYIRFTLGASPAYRFAVGVDAPAPGPL